MVADGIASLRSRINFFGVMTGARVANSSAFWFTLHENVAAPCGSGSATRIFTKFIVIFLSLGLLE
jgi:hypothetical protein